MDSLVEFLKSVPATKGGAMFTIGVLGLLLLIAWVFICEVVRIVKLWKERPWK